MAEVITSALQAINRYKEVNDPDLHPCQGSKFHSPRPLRVRSFRLSTGQSLYLCGTCKDNLDLYTGLQDYYEGKLAWEIQRSFGNELRRVANYVIRNSFSETS